MGITGRAWWRVSGLLPHDCTAASLAPMPTLEKQVGLALEGDGGPGPDGAHSQAPGAVSRSLAPGRSYSASRRRCSLPLPHTSSFPDVSKLDTSSSSSGL